MLSVNLYWRTIVLPFLNDSMMYVPFPLISLFPGMDRSKRSPEEHVTDKSRRKQRKCCRRRVWGSRM